MLKKSPTLDSLIQLLRRRAADMVNGLNDGSKAAMEQMAVYKEMTAEAKELVAKHLKEDSERGVYEAIANAIKEVSL